MKAVKILLGLLVTIAVVAALAVFLLLKNLDGIIKQVIETVGSEVTQVSVTLDRAHTELKNGRAELHGLTIANPQGFDGPYLFKMGEVALQIEPSSLGGPVIVIDEVLIDGAQISAELKGNKTNVQALQQNVAKSTAGSGKQKNTTDTKPSTEKSSGEAADVRLAVKKFSFINSDVQLASDQWGDRTLTMPNIVMKNLGDSKTGLTPEQLAEEVVNRINKGVQKAIENEVQSLAKERAQEELDKAIDEKLSDKDKQTLNQLKGLFGQ